eukprot:scaffold229_cov136-Cylindrotheca_fusiformis.AAC.5
MQAMNLHSHSEMQSSSHDQLSKGDKNQIPLEAMINLRQSNPTARSIAQIAPQRLTPSFPFARNGQARLGNLNVLYDAAVAGGKKRTVGESSQLLMGERKRAKSRMSEARKVTASDNPVLMERLNALGGGFPMPRWARPSTNKVNSKQGSKEDMQHEKRVLLERISSLTGGFPMPPSKGDGKSVLKAGHKSFSSFKTLWHQTDPEIQKEMLSRRLERRDVRMMNRFNTTSEESD